MAPTPKKTRVNVADSLEQASSLHKAPAWFPPTAPTRPVAVLICHGMGQQVPFETLASTAQQLQAPGSPTPVVRQVHFIDSRDSSRTKWLPRAEILVEDPNGGPAREVHVYEAYWAPLTEGVISLMEVVRFLASAGIGGVWRSFRLLPLRMAGLQRFERWVFGQERQYGVHVRTPLSLLCALVVVLGLVVINTVLTLVLGSSVLGLQAHLQTALVSELTVDLLWLLGTAALALGLLGLSVRRHNRAMKSKTPRKLKFGLLEGVGLVALVLLLAAVVVMAGVMAYHYVMLHNAEASEDMFSLAGRRVVVKPWGIGVVWAVAAGASFFARKFLVQYLGDVAIYLNSYKVDRFYEVRQQIKSMVFGTACTLYGARESGSSAFAYDRVVLAGHSLGSVVAYDALNALLYLDESMGETLHVADRTNALITYGSPLDKTAYLFDLQHPEAPLRDGLAASVQPLIRNLKARLSIKWVNIFSKLDVISGSLEFYQLPHDTLPKGPEVDNRPDPQAITPIMAHTQYDSNPLLTKVLREAIL